MQPNLLALLDHSGGFDDGLVSIFVGSIRHDHWLYEQQPHGTHRDCQEEQRHDAAGTDVVGVSVTSRRHEQGVDLVGGEHEGIGGSHRDEQRQSAPVNPGLFTHKYLGTSIRIQESTYVT